jgi:hypothetical protein
MRTIAKRRITRLFAAAQGQALFFANLEFHRGDIGWLVGAITKGLRF